MYRLAVLFSVYLFGCVLGEKGGGVQDADWGVGNAVLRASAGWKRRRGVIISCKLPCWVSWVS